MVCRLLFQKGQFTYMKKKIFSVLCASALLLSSIASGCYSDGASDSTQKTCVFTVNGEKIYNSGRALYIIRDDDTFEYVENELTADESKADTAIFPNYVRGILPNHLVGNDCAISTMFDNGQIVSWDLTDPKNASYDILYDIYNIKSLWDSAVEKYDLDCTSEELASAVLGETSIKLIDGGDGYVYFNFLPSVEYANQMMPVAYNIIRFAKDGTDFEIMDNKAGALTIKDGYMYYYYGGYSYDSVKKESVIDESSAGIYKMKLDGSEKTPLVKQNLNSEQKSNPYYAMNAAGNMNIIGNELYYISTDSYLYKVELNGDKLEKVTKNMCNNYYVDTASDTLYYVQGGYRTHESEGYPLVYVPLSGGEEKQLLKSYVNMSSLEGIMTVDGKYLYFSNSDRYLPINEHLIKNSNGDESENDEYCGLRLDLETGEMQKLNSRIEIKFEEDEFGEFAANSGSDPVIKWEKVDSNVYW